MLSKYHFTPKIVDMASIWEWVDDGLHHLEIAAQQALQIFAAGQRHHSILAGARVNLCTCAENSYINQGAFVG